MHALSKYTGRSAYTLQEIADWQLKKASGEVTLPDLQRGFVWKPYQTENLWDSLLRRFPVGTFILAPSADAGANRFELLDGQQRATAIAFGFFDPWAEKSPKEGLWRIGNAADIPILWLDLHSKDNENVAFNTAVTYGFRLLTRSQPWGYERRDNQTPLNTVERRKFLTILANSLLPEEQGKRYLELPLTLFWPWDARLPVPFAFLLNSFQAADWKERLAWLCEYHYSTLQTRYLAAGAYLKRLKDFLAGPQAENLRSAVLYAIQKTCVPVLNVPREVFEQNSQGSAAKTGGEDGDEYVPDEIETLFIRINSAGTPLAGEELIYSIYKSIFPESIQLVEQAGANFMLPSRLVSLATRIVQADVQRRKAKTDDMAMPQKPRVKDFRRYIYDSRSGFKERLRTFISSLAADNVFKRALDILCGKESFQLPSALAVDIVRHSPEIIFILIYRLHRKDEIAIGSEEHRRVLGFLTALSWFGRGEKPKDHDPCLKYLWRDLLTSDQKAFWCRSVLNETIRLRNDQLVMLPLLPPRMLTPFVREFIITKGVPWDHLENPAGNSNIARWYKNYYQMARASDYAADAWWAFLGKLERQRGLVLYAQREFVTRWFGNFNHVGVQNLEDTNCPWDWDHIHAQKLIKRKWNVDWSLKEWHSSIGNLRVWPMELNRSDADAVPSAKLNPSDTGSNPLFQRYGLANGADILRASFIDNKKTGFADIGEECDIKKKESTRRIRYAVLTRMLALYQHWFDELRLAKFFPNSL